MKFRRARSRALAIVALALVTAALVVWSMARPRAAAAKLAPEAQETYAVTASSTTDSSPKASATGSSALASPSTPRASSASASASGGLVVLGDDYAKGAGWVNDLGQQLGLAVTNLSENGEGYRSTPASCAAAPCQNFATAATRLAALNPQVVVVEGGEADGDVALDASAQTALQAITKAAPSAKVLVVSPLSNQFPRPYWMTLHTRSVQGAATAAGATYVDVATVSAAPASYGADGTLTAQASSTLVSALAKAAQ